MNSLFVEPAGLDGSLRITGSYGLGGVFEDVAYERKMPVISALFSGEMQDLGAHLASAGGGGPERARPEPARHDAGHHRSDGVHARSIELISTHLKCREQDDRGYVTGSLRVRPGAAIPESIALVYDFVERVLTLRFKRWMARRAATAWLLFVKKWQQFSGPIMAKGVEDSTMYVYNRLISMNEVGGLHETRYPDRFHAFLQQRRALWPHTMNATSTHDTKRSEDVRARINVLSEIPEQWIRHATRWSRWLARCAARSMPTRSTFSFKHSSAHGRCMRRRWKISRSDEAIRDKSQPRSRARIPVGCSRISSTKRRCRHTSMCCSMTSDFRQAFARSAIVYRFMGQSIRCRSCF